MPQNSSNNTGGWAVRPDRIAKVARFKTPNPFIHRLNTKTAAGKKDSDGWGHHTAKLKTEKIKGKSIFKNVKYSPSPALNPQRVKQLNLKKLIDSAEFLSRYYKGLGSTESMIYVQIYTQLKRLSLLTRPFNSEEIAMLETYKKKIELAMNKLENKRKQDVGGLGAPPPPPGDPPDDPDDPDDDPPEEKKEIPLRITKVPVKQVVKPQVVESKMPVVSESKMPVAPEMPEKKPQLKEVVKAPALDIETLKLKLDNTIGEFVTTRNFKKNKKKIRKHFESQGVTRIKNYENFDKMIKLDTAFRHLAAQNTKYILDIKNNRIVYKKNLDNNTRLGYKTISPMIR